MINKKFFLFFAICIALAFEACDKPVAGPSLSPQEKMLTGRIWKLKSLTVPQVTDPTKDSSITKQCSDSALMAFDAYKNFQIADPTRACDSTIVPYDMGTWVLSADADSLWMNGRRKFIWKIQTLNDTIIKATFRDSVSPEKNWVKTITFK